VGAQVHSHNNSKHRSNCPICSQRNLGGGEIYVLAGTGGISIFDVEKAREIALDGRASRLIPADMLDKMLQFNRFESLHLRHVNTQQPGVVAQRSAGPFLIDGTHRAIRSLREHREFSAFLLAPEETQSCLLSQDIGETDIGVAVRAIRKLLLNHPETHDLEIEIDGGPEAIQQIRKLLTKEENRRIKISTAQPPRTP
jgi:hypothetical protein